MHTDALACRGFGIQEFLHTETFTSCTEAFTQNRLCTQTRLLYADALIHTSLCTQIQKEVLHRETLHIDAFTQGTCTQWFYTGKPSIFFKKKPLHTEVFTHRNIDIYTEKPLHTGIFSTQLLNTQLLNTHFFSQSSLYTEQLLHTETFRQRSLCTQMFFHREIFTQTGR